MSEVLVTVLNKDIPLYSKNVKQELVERALKSKPFQEWIENMERSIKSHNGEMILHSILLQSVDMFGSQKVGFIKIKADVTVSGEKVPGVCFLRGMGVGILVSLYCSDTTEEYAILVDQPRIPLGESNMLEIPAGMLDGSGNFTGVAAQELQEECGIRVRENDLIDLTDLAYGQKYRGVCPSAGGCDEYIRLMYCKLDMTLDEINAIQGKLGGLRHHGELITLRVIKFDDIWKECCDAKALCALFLLQQLRKEGKICERPSGNQQVLPTSIPACPRLTMNNVNFIPQLAFGLYQVENETCEEIVLNAIRCGYRHLDCAPLYGNEAAVGRALNRCEVPRSELYICSKVWNDAQKLGRMGVRRSFEQSLRDLNCEYFDMYLIHWPVPGYHTDSYKELELLCMEGKVRSIGLSNYSKMDYEELLAAGIKIKPAVNQIQISPVMYRRDQIAYFLSRGIVPVAYKPLHRGEAFHIEPIPTLAAKYGVSHAQIMLRWSLQHNFVFISKTSSESRLRENLSIRHFQIEDSDMQLLDEMTTAEDILKRDQYEFQRKMNL